jgi:hypothetical protein
MPNFLCEISNKRITSCSESEDDFNYSDVSFQYYLGPDSRPTEILISAENEQDAKNKAQAQLDKDYPDTLT